MKYLTIDTTTKITALALAQSGQLVSEGFLHTGKTHSERLIPMLDQLLTAADWKLEELDFLAVVRGPGSFTGIRIGIATAQGFAQVLKKPLIGITTLDTLAWAGYGREEDTVVILDARKGEWYYARYRWQREMVCIDGPMAITPAALIEKTRLQNERVYFVGDGVSGAKEYLREMLPEQAVIPLEHQYLPRGAYAVCEAWKHWLKIENSGREEGFAVTPLYIRLSEAEVNYRKKHGN